MNPAFIPGLRLAGAGLLLLAILHGSIARTLRWREDIAWLTPINAAIFRVHNFFICLVLVLMGLPCLLDLVNARRELANCGLRSGRGGV